MSRWLIPILFYPLIALAAPESEHSYFGSGKIDTQRIQTLAPGRKDVVALYDRMGTETLWHSGGSLTDTGQQAIDFLKGLDSQGLNPQDYKRAWQEGLEGSERDVAISTQLLNAIHHIHVGRLNPRKVDSLIKLTPHQIQAVEILALALKDTSVDWTDKLIPHDPIYRRLLVAYKKYQDLGANYASPTLSLRSLKVGQSHPDIKKIRRHLEVLGDFQGDIDSPVYDTALKEAIANFQDRHAIQDDGALNAETLRQLQQPISWYIKRLKASLERWRWLPNMPARSIVVNIANYHVYAFQDGAQAFSMPIIVGQKYRKTPIFQAPLVDVTFNPVWRVPPNIIARDKLPKLRRTGGHLGAGYSFYDRDGHRLDPTSTDWDSYGPSDFRIVQSAGPWNALGPLRFNIENPYTIYMHGTPDTHLFQKAKRNFSSGCIRLEDPVKMAKFVFNDAAWDEAAIESKIDAKATRVVKLPHHVAVFVVYSTAFIGMDGVERFADDVYGLDSKTLDALDGAES